MTLDYETVFPNPENYGLYLRDYFAAHAMAGYLSSPGEPFAITRESAKRIAEAAFLIADAMLEMSEENSK
jgi:hypothetical protein